MLSLLLMSTGRTATITGPTDSFARSCPKRPCAVWPCSHSVALPCSYSHYLPPPARRAQLQPACRALLLRASRPAAACTSRPAAASASRPAAANASRSTAASARPAANTAAAAARATAAARGGAAGSAGGAAGAGRATGSAGGAAGARAARGGQRRSLPLPDDPTPQQLRKWVLQRARLGGGGFGFLRTAQRRQQSQQETFSPQMLSELFPQQCVIGSVEAAALGASESAAALGASESAAALGACASPATGLSLAEALHTFQLDSSASRCFFHDCTTLTPLAAPAPVSLADLTGGPVVARAYRENCAGMIGLARVGVQVLTPEVLYPITSAPL
ncbi:unnamed protein product [Closterium sp. NIES-54]